MRTKSLSPVAIVAFGTILTGVFVAAVVGFTVSEPSPGILLTFLAGTTAGVFIFGSMAIVIATRARMTRSIARYAHRAMRVTVAVTLISLGYLIALRRHDVDDSPTTMCVTVLLTFFGTLASILLATLLESRDEQAARPSDGPDLGEPSEGDASETE